MRFYTAYDRPDHSVCPLEEHADEGLVERDGYMDTQQMVERLLLAGESLQVFREAEYAADEDIPEDAPANREISRLDAILAARALSKKIVSQSVEQGLEVEEKKVEDDKKGEVDVKEEKGEVK